jgi:hypothetical protein
MKTELILYFHIFDIQRNSFKIIYSKVINLFIFSEYDLKLKLIKYLRNKRCVDFYLEGHSFKAIIVKNTGKTSV